MASPADVISAINASKNSWNIVAPSLLVPQKLVPDFPADSLDGYCNSAADGKLKQVAPSLLEPAKKSIASKKPGNDSDKGKGVATLSKRNSVGVGIGDHSPKLLKSIKIEKP